MKRENLQKCIDTIKEIEIAEEQLKYINSLNCLTVQTYSGIKIMDIGISESYDGAYSQAGRRFIENIKDLLNSEIESLKAKIEQL